MPLRIGGHGGQLQRPRKDHRNGGRFIYDRLRGTDPSPPFGDHEGDTGTLGFMGSFTLDGPRARRALGQGTPPSGTFAARATWTGEGHGPRQPGAVSLAPSLHGAPTRAQGEYAHVRGSDLWGRPQPIRGRGSTPPEEGAHLQLMDLGRDLGDAEAICEALTAEKERHLQEVMRAWSNFRRAENDSANMHKDHATVSGDLVRQRCPTPSMEVDGTRLLRQLADAQVAAVDIAWVVDERLNRHLAAVLEAV